MTDNLCKRFSDRLPLTDLKQLSLRSPYYWLKDAAIDWAIMITALSAFAYFTSPIVFALSVLVLGNRQHALGLLGHDGTHYTLSYKKNINDLITNVFAWWPIGLTMSGYRNLHNMHHKFVGTPNDPEVIYKQLKAEQWNLPSKIPDLAKLAGKDLLGFGASDYFTILAYAKPSKRTAFIPLVAFHTIFVSTTLYAGLWQLPVAWYTSILTAFPMYFRLRLWLEHQGTDFVHRLQLNKFQGALLAPHLAWYHWEHHAYPTVPYCNLPIVRQLMPSEPVITLKQLVQKFRNSKFIHGGAVFMDTSDPVAVPNPTNTNYEPEQIKAA